MSAIAKHRCTDHDSFRSEPTQVHGPLLRGYNYHYSWTLHTLEEGTPTISSGRWPSYAAQS